MPQLLACTGGEADVAVLHPVAAALARALRVDVLPLALPDDPAAQLATVLRGAAARSVVLAVLPLPPGDTPELVAALLLQCPKPLVLVPTGEQARQPDVLSRVLVPLDGTEESAAAVAGTLALFAAGGVDIVVLHVFQEATVPRFWDQPVHARQSWEGEFLARFCPEPSARLELRGGSPGDGILDVAESEDADLIALGWSQTPSTGRARTVWSTVAGARVPVMLLPVGPTPPGPSGSAQALSAGELL